MITTLKKNKYIQAFFINMFLGLICFGYFIVKNDGLFILSDDFNFQQIPFTMLCNQAFKSGDIFWNWSIELGSPLVDTMSFYGLGNPLFWISLLFPSTSYPYLVGWFYIINYSLAGLFSFAYFHKFIHDKRYAILASILYTFSGFQAENLLFYFFTNNVVFFPLLLLGLEEKIQNRKRGVFAFAVLINALQFYYLFIAEVIFVIVYYIIRFIFSENWKNGVKQIGGCLLEGIIGTGLSSVLLVPSVLSVLNNPRASSFSSFSMFMSNREYLQIIHALLFPGEIMPSHSVIYDADFSSMSGYLPFISLSLVLAYIIKKKTDWLSIMIYTCSLFVFIPFLNNSFTLFTSSYHRWYYMLVLILCLASGLVLEKHKEYKVILSTFITVTLMILFVLFIIVWDKYKFPMIFKSKEFYLLSFFSITGVFLTMIIHLFSKLKLNFPHFRLMFVGIALYSSLTIFYNINAYQNYRKVDANDFYSKIIAFQSISCEDQYRLSTNEDDSTSMIRNIAMTASLPGINTFCSTVHPSIMEFYESLGLERKIFTPARPLGLDSYLSSKYYITEVKDPEKPCLNMISEGDIIYYIYESENALPIGYTYDSYMLKSDFLKLDKNLRTTALLRALVIPNDSETEVSKIIQHYDPTLHGFLSVESIESYIKAHENETSENFSRDSTSFQCDIASSSKKYAFFSIPYDENWTASVNNKNVDILSVNGLMAIPIDAGTNHIIFNYHPFNLILGFVVSLISLVFFTIYIFYPYKKAFSSL